MNLTRSAIALALAVLLTACGGGDVECRMEFYGPLQSGATPVFNPANPAGWVEVCE